MNSCYIRLGSSRPISSNKNLHRASKSLKSWWIAFTNQRVSLMPSSSCRSCGPGGLGHRVGPEENRLVLRQYQSNPESEKVRIRTFQDRNDSSMIVDWTISCLGKTPHITAFRSLACTLVPRSSFHNLVSYPSGRY